MNHQETAPTFDDLGLHQQILKAVANLGYTTPTPIQQGAIPHALAGTDLLLSAQTGSGKTAAFVLPILDRLAKTPKFPKLSDDQKAQYSQKSAQRHQKTPIRALILTPTRELAMQVQDNVRQYGSQLRGIFSVPLVGGSPYGGQIRALRKGVQIIIATPGRLIDHMNEGRVELSDLDVLVLDEADRMLDMGFAEDINTILQNAPATRQTIMSSATWDGAVGKIAQSFTNNPQIITIKTQSGHIDESVYYCDDFHHKNKILLSLLDNDDIKQAVIFTATKRSTEQLAQTLTEAGLSARYLHGDLPQGKRNRIISEVKSGKCSFLIATDVAARGIDISSISHVVNYDLPRQVEDYVHRIGRCGRAGRTGVAMNLCSKDDKKQLSHIHRYLKRDIKEAVIEGLEPKWVFADTQRDGRKKGRFADKEHPRQKRPLTRQGDRSKYRHVQGDIGAHQLDFQKLGNHHQSDMTQKHEYKPNHKGGRQGDMGSAVHSAFVVDGAYYQSDRGLNKRAKAKPRLATYSDTARRPRPTASHDRHAHAFYVEQDGRVDGKPKFGNRAFGQEHTSGKADGRLHAKRSFAKKEQAHRANQLYRQDIKGKAKKPKAVEEIFFAHSHEKTTKRKFGHH